MRHDEHCLVPRHDFLLARAAARLLGPLTGRPPARGKVEHPAAAPFSVAALLAMVGLLVVEVSTEVAGWLLAAAGVLLMLAVVMLTLIRRVNDPRLRRILALTWAYHRRARAAGADVLTAELGAHHARLVGLAGPLNRAWRSRERLLRRLQAVGVREAAHTHESSLLGPLVAERDDDLVMRGVFDELEAGAARVDATTLAVDRVEAATRQMVAAAKGALRARHGYATAANPAPDGRHAADVADTEEALARVRQHRDATTAAVAELSA